MAVSNGVPELVRADNAIRQARALVNFYMGRPLAFGTKISTGFQDAAGGPVGDRMRLSQQALRSRPEVQRLRIAERSADAQLELARAESKMRLDFNASYGIASRKPGNLFDANYTRWTTGVSLQLPVFDGFRRNGMVYQAVANQRASQLAREKMERQIPPGPATGVG